MSIYKAITLLILFSASSLAAEEMDAELAKLSQSLAALVKEKGKTKVTVLDFTDLQGRTSELGRYIAEQLTVGLVLEKGDFRVLDRANLKSILAEHKLTAKGLIDPENAKKLGLFSGVDALILGTVIPKKQSVGLTARLITTETAEVVGAAKAEFKSDETVQDLLASATSDRVNGGSDGNGPSIVKTIGALRVEIEPLRIVNEHDLLVTMNISNQSKKQVWTAVKRDFSQIRGSIFDSNGNQYTCHPALVAGIVASDGDHGELTEATELEPGASTTATLRFGGLYKKQKPGRCTLQLELLLSDNFDGEKGDCTTHNLVTKIETK